jgi:peptidyl-prolyl cis-trans isomerase A (cyclophilin A)
MLWVKLVFTMIRSTTLVACKVCSGAALLASAFLVSCRASPPPRRVAGPESAQLQARPADTKPETKVQVSPSEAPQPEPAPSAGPVGPSAALLDPSIANATAPERFTVLLETSKGALHIDLRRSWAPHGVDRFYNLVKIGYFDGNVFFRVVGDFVAQVGIHGDPAVNRAWRTRSIEDDPVVQSNVRGMVSFAASGKNTRTTQFFIDLGDNATLDRLGFAPLGRVREIDIAQKLHAGYGEAPPAGRGPLQARIQRDGDAYLKAQFPELDSIKRATITDEKPSPARF